MHLQIMHKHLWDVLILNFEILASTIIIKYFGVTEHRNLLCPTVCFARMGVWLEY